MTTEPSGTQPHRPSAPASWERTVPADAAAPGAHAEDPASGGTTTSTGLDPAISGLLAYALGWVSGLALFLVEKHHAPTRFHAAQSMVLFGGATVFWAVVSAMVWVPLLGLVLAVIGLLLVPLFLALWIFLMVRAYQQAEVRLPLIATIADRLVA